MLSRFRQSVSQWADTTWADLGASLESIKSLAGFTELLQKSVRAQARLSLKLEDVERKLEGGFAELRGLLPKVERQPDSSASWEDFFDALDVLDEASRLSTPVPGLAEGLGGVRSRLEQFLAHQSFKRISPLGLPPDGRLFRIAGADTQSDFPEGSVARIIRAAILQKDRVIREGEVLVSRRTV